MSPRTRKDIPNPKRCTWAEGDPLMEKYHDEEWGFPVRTIRKHFEQLTLEIFQAGLSWRTILHKRVEFRKEFAGFSPEKVALFTEKDIRRILGNPASCGTERKSRRPSRTPKDSWPSRKNTWLIQPLSRILAGRSGPSLQKIFREEFTFMGPKIAEAYLESVGKIPELHDPRCCRNVINR